MNNPYPQLAADLRPWYPTLVQAADAILDQEISKYPIFVCFEGEIAIGLPLVEADGQSWSINASTLEEFATKGLIEADKVEDFQQVYKDPTEFFCFFVVNQEGATFAFLPRE